jgi:hypothetical protein
VGEFVALKCRAEVLSALAEGLTGFAPTNGDPDWLVAGVWLRTGGADFLATGSVDVLADGFVARSLKICTAEELVERIEADLPDVSARLFGRGSPLDLGEVPSVPPAPATVTPWHPHEVSVLIRASPRATHVNKVACGLLFSGPAGQALLIGADPATLAIVLSEDHDLIERYCADCAALTPGAYLQLLGD